MPKILHLDIETIPYRDITNEDLIPPKNYTKPETIAKWKEEEGLADTIKAHSLDLFKCRVLCIGVAIDNNEPVVLMHDDEKELFVMFDKWFQDNLSTLERHTVTFSGFNIKGFDFPIIALRMYKYNMPMKDYFSLSINKYSRLFDLASLIEGFKYGAKPKQDYVCEFLNIPLKDGMDGSMVYTFYKAGKFFEIKTYCKSDVVTVQKIYNTFS